MTDNAVNVNTVYVLTADRFQDLLDSLAGKGYSNLGPTIKAGAVIYDSITKVNDLPVGWVDRLDAGTYRLAKSSKKTFFGCLVGPHSWKKYLHPPVCKLWEARRNDGRLEIAPPEEENTKRAFIGVRPCDLQALTINDAVLSQGPYADTTYQRHRENLFIIAVNCVHPGGTCFCAAMHTGPRATSGFDLSLTEIFERKHHHFTVEIGSRAGMELLNELSVKPATDAEVAKSNKLLERAATKMGRSLDAAGIKELLQSKFDDPHWEQIGDRCLSCGNCTMVCPTCFCVTVEDSTDLTGHRAERRTKWDSCFTADFSYIHGGCIRSSTMSRYRQWMMHKFVYWPDQFDSSGCVGCGRCITWCPAGIDITEEARAIQEKE